ncbi:universal stress protein [Pseudoalteromonas sp. CnMc7-15]|uniref:universal stress protein n=1 Tax=unclassified Pseudoalteromonas TaxID=194690 RepID=UPI001EF5F139|nr:universal stress protein [Pseudoalteromonas sp. CnMc7-15]MCG7565424.1 universal stress protein [Pseudoalteromonas sp. CnMc7-15]
MKKIITCVDGSAITQAVTDAAIWSANKLQHPLCFLHTIERQQQHGADDLSGAIGLGARSSLLNEMTELDEKRGKMALELGQQLLEDLATQAKQANVEQVETRQRHGDVVEAIIDLSDMSRLIVIGRCGENHENNFKALGSHIETLLRQASAPVLLVPKQFSAPKSFMIAYDGRATADKALQKVIDGGLLHGIPCHLVAVKNKERDLAPKLKLATQRLQEQGFDVKAELLEGPIYDSLTAYKQANDIELMVMGAFAHSKLRQLFVGSNTLRMLETLDIPLVVLR